MGVDTSFDLAKLHASVVHWVTEDTHQGCFVTDLQLRVESFNLFNTVNLQNPVNDLGNPLFGRSTSAANPGRIIQVSGRLQF